MSEPRKLHTESAYGASQDQYEKARRLAQQQAAQNARRRIQRPVQPVQGRQINQHPAAPQPEEHTPRPAAAQPVPQPARQEPTPQPIEEPQEPKPLTRAQRQAMALRADYERKYGPNAAANTQRIEPQPAPRPVRPAASQPAAAQPAARPAAAQPTGQEHRRIIRPETAAAQPARPAQGQAGTRTINRTPRPAPQAQPAQPTQPAQPAQAAPRPARNGVFDYDAVVGGVPQKPHKSIEMEQDTSKRTGAGGKPPRKPGSSPQGSGKGKKPKKKKKGSWWKTLLIVVLVLAIIFGGAFAIITNALKPNGGISGTTISSIVNTPKEYQGKELNLLVVGIDRSTEDGSVSSDGVNDGMTDMIMWLHFDNENKSVSMLQIPRNIMVTTDRSVSGNYQINAVAKTQGNSGYNNIDALAQLLYDQFKLECDGYISIRLEALSELIDILGGIDVNVPEAIDYRNVKGGGNSYLPAGYQRLTGAQAEFFLRARKTYNTSDLKRLEVQRYFYSALFARLRSMTVVDIARMLPFMLTYVETDLSVSELVSVAVSMLKIHSDKICLARVPVYMGDTLKWPLNVEKPNSVVVVAKQETADVLNQYFRAADRQVDASELNVCQALDTSGMAPQDAAVKVMNDLNKEVVDAQQNNNHISEGDTGTDVYEVVPDSEPASETTDGDSTAEPAA